MTRSANEVMVLATKAARGTGAPPAQAAQFGAAAVAHLCAGRSMDVLQAALNALPQGPIITLPLAIARIAERAVEGQSAGRIEDADPSLVHSYLQALPYHAQFDAAGAAQLDLTTAASRTIPQRIDLPVDIYDDWSLRAARLLVPESDASRLSGAGAGLSDND